LVRLAALKTVSAILSTDGAHHAPFAQLIPKMFQVVGDAFKTSNDDALSESIQELMVLVRAKPRLFSSLYTAIISAMTQVASKKELEDSTRRTVAAATTFFLYS